MSRLISVIALSGALSVASGFSASEPATARRININTPQHQHALVFPLISSTHQDDVRACQVGVRRRSITVARMANNQDEDLSESLVDKRPIEDAIASGDSFSFILFPSLVLKFIVIMIYKFASDIVEYTPQYFERMASGGLSLGEAVRDNHEQQAADNVASGNTLAINPQAHHHHGGDDTGFSDVLGLPTLFLKFIAIMMVKSARDAVYYPSQYIERLFKPSQQEGGGDEISSNIMAVEENAPISSNSPVTSGFEEEFIEEAAFSLFLLPVLLLKFSIVMLVKVAKDMVDYTLPYLESLARLEVLGNNDQTEDVVDEFADVSQVIYSKDGDYWLK